MSSSASFLHSLKPSYGLDPNDHTKQFEPATTPGDSRSQWCEAAYEEAVFENDQSDELQSMSRYIDYIVGKQWPKGRPSYKSKPVDNRVFPLFWELVALLTDLRPSFSVSASNKTFDDHSEVIKKCVRSWWLTADADMKLAMIVIYAILTSGGGKLHWNNRLRNGDGDFDLLPISPDNLLYLKAQGFDPDTAQAVINRTPKPLAWFIQKYGKLGSTVPVDLAYSRYSVPAKLPGNMTRSMFDNLSLAMQHRFSGDPTMRNCAFPQALHREYWIDDWTVNESANDVFMGPWKSGIGIESTPLATWSYKVAPGEPLYPRKRLMCLGGPVVLYDGPSPYWHGQYPFGLLRMNVVPWQLHGLSDMKTLTDLQDIVNNILAGVLDMVKRSVNPGFTAPSNAFSDSQWKTLDWSMPGMKAAYRIAGGGAPQFAPQPQLPAFVLQVLQMASREMDQSSGIATINEVIRKKQVPSADTIEEARQAQQTPLRLKGRNIEVFLRRFGGQMVYNIFQFYTAERRMQLLGPSGLTFEDYDFKPATMVPAGADPMMHARNFAFMIEPGSMLNINKVEQASLFMNLRKMGDIDRKTLFKQLDLAVDAKVVQDNLDEEKKRAFMQALAAKSAAGAQ